MLILHVVIYYRRKTATDWDQVSLSNDLFAIVDIEGLSDTVRGVNSTEVVSAHSGNGFRSSVCINGRKKGSPPQNPTCKLSGHECLAFSYRTSSVDQSCWTSGWLSIVWWKLGTFWQLTHTTHIDCAIRVVINQVLAPKTRRSTIP